MPLELSSPVRSEGHGSSTDRGGRKQRNLPLVQRHRLVHPDPPSPKASRHTQDNQLTPQSESDRSTGCGPGVSPPALPAPASPSAQSFTVPGGQASRASWKVELLCHILLPTWDTLLRPLQDVTSLAFLSLPLEVRPPELSWRAELAHMAGDVSPYDTGKYLWDPGACNDSFPLTQPDLWLATGLRGSIQSCAEPHRMSEMASSSQPGELAPI